MRDVTLVILNSLRIKCHIRRPLRAEERLSLLFKVTLLHEKVQFHLSVTYNFCCIS